jgi:Flp pilus assembly protein TadG
MNTHRADASTLAGSYNPQSHLDPSIRSTFPNFSNCNGPHFSIIPKRHCLPLEGIDQIGFDEFAANTHWPQVSGSFDPAGWPGQVLMRLVCPDGKRRGAAAVELAVVLPFLILILIGVWEVGRFIQLQEIMNNAARDGARLASQAMILNTDGSMVEIAVNSGTPNVTAAITQYLQAAGIQNLNGLQITFQYLNGDTTLTQPYQGVKNQQFLVQVTLPYANLRWTNLSIINPTTLSGTCVWQIMVDDPITVSSALPGWSP